MTLRKQNPPDLVILLHIGIERLRQHVQGFHRLMLDMVPEMRGGYAHGILSITKKLCAIGTYLQ